MATVIIKIGHIEDDKGQLVNVQSPKPPFQVGVGINSKEYSSAAGDYVNGDDLEFEILGSDEVKYAHFTNNLGVTEQYVESDMVLPRVGKILTVSTVPSVLKSYIVHNT